MHVSVKKMEESLAIIYYPDLKNLHYLKSIIHYSENAYYWNIYGGKES